MTKSTIWEKGVFHSQVVNSWLPSRDPEFTSWIGTQHNTCVCVRYTAYYTQRFCIDLESISTVVNIACVGNVDDDDVRETSWAQTAAEFVAVVITVDDSVTTSDTQLIGRAQTDATTFVARTVAFIAQVRTVKHAVTSPSHVNTRTTSTAELPPTARCVPTTLTLPFYSTLSSHIHQLSEADVRMFSMFNRTGAPHKGAPKRGPFPDPVLNSNEFWP